MSKQSDHHEIEADPRWASLRARDHAADGSFVYAVTTTGVDTTDTSALDDLAALLTG